MLSVTELAIHSFGAVFCDHAGFGLLQSNLVEYLLVVDLYFLRACFCLSEYLPGSSLGTINVGAYFPVHQCSR